MATVVGNARAPRMCALVLMARFVDRHGNIIRRDAIDSIEYSVCRWEKPAVGLNCADVICEREPLRAADVMLHPLQHEPDWEAEASGFNFRHCFKIPVGTGRWTSRSRFEVRYVFTQVTGEVTAVRFRIRATRND